MRLFVDKSGGSLYHSTAFARRPDPSSTATAAAVAVAVAGPEFSLPAMLTRTAPRILTSYT